MMAGVTETWSRRAARAVCKGSGGKSGLLGPGRHKLRILGGEEGLEGQSEPDEPAGVLNPERTAHFAAARR
jgi:hypothetical protein